MEVWEDVVGYEGLYEVSNRGRVKSTRLVTQRSDHLMRVPEKILKTPVSKRKYHRINLRKDGETKMEYIHILVARAFIGERPPGYDVDHKDKNRYNNCASNLRYLDTKSNRGHIGNTNAKKK